MLCLQEILPDNGDFFHPVVWCPRGLSGATHRSFGGRQCPLCENSEENRSSSQVSIWGKTLAEMGAGLPFCGPSHAAPPATQTPYLKMAAWEEQAVSGEMDGQQSPAQGGGHPRRATACSREGAGCRAHRAWGRPRRSTLPPGVSGPSLPFPSTSRFLTSAEIYITAKRYKSLFFF